jgi:hypothetical protein
MGETNRPGRKPGKKLAKAGKTKAGNRGLRRCASRSLWRHMSEGRGKAAKKL